MRFLRHCAFIAYHDFFRRDGTSRAWRLLERSQWWSNEHLAEYQQKKLADLLRHACSNVPYYQRVFREIGLSVAALEDPSTIRRFPLLDKTIIRENYSDLCVRNIDQYQIKESSTSGSTGESLFFLIDVSRNALRMIATFRNYGWCNVSPFEREALLWGARFDEPDTRLLIDRLRLWTRPLFFLSSYDLSEEGMANYAQQLLAYRPRLLTSYPSPLERFAEFCIAERIRIPSLRVIICSAEQLFDYQRRTIEKAFGVPVFNRYGCREFGNIAQQCEMLGGLHLNVERVYVEIIDNSGNTCVPGQLGELVITDLDNYAMPFIRYRIGDMAAWSERHCPCGRGLPLLDRVDGRAFDLIKTRSGRYLSGTFWTLLLRHISQDIVALQVRQGNIAGVEILLKMPSGQLPHESEQLLRRKIAEKAPDLEVHIKYVDHIPLTKSGKRRFVISNVE